MTDWNDRIATVWSDDALDDAQRIARIDQLAAERPEDDAAALFERAGSRDSAGLEAEAESLYRRALDAGLDDLRRPQAVIQLASTLRNLGRLAESRALLEAELAREPQTPLRDEASAFLALTLVSSGDARGAASLALTALAPHLTRYARSVRGYAAELVDGA